MDGNSFDEFTRIWSERPSRRSVLRALAGGIGGGVVALLGGAAGAAPRCKRVGQACQTTADCCPGPNANGNVYCAASGNKKTCQSCPSTTPTACNGGCADLNADPANCGACGHVCPAAPANAAATCTAGQCGFACNAGYKECNGGCIPTDTCCETCVSPKTCNAGECCVPRGTLNTCQTNADCCGTDVCYSEAGNECVACIDSGQTCSSSVSHENVCCPGLTCQFNGATLEFKCQ